MVGIALWMTRGAWGGRPPAGDDVMAHITRADFGLGHLFFHGRLDGWFPRFMLGHREFLFYGQGFTALLGLLRVATLGGLSNTGAMKVAAVGSFVLFGPAAAFLARSLGLSRLASVVAGILALAVNNVYGVGLAAVFVIGLVPQQVAALAACVALGSAVRTLTDTDTDTDAESEPGRRARLRWPALCAVSFAAIVVTHVITIFIIGFFGVITVAALLVDRRPPARAWLRLGLAALASLGLAAFWAVPFLVHRDLHGPVTTWATPAIGRRLHDILAGNILFGPGIGWLAVAGLVIAAVMVVRRQPFALAFLIAPAAFLVLSHNVIHWWPDNEIAVQLANRGLGFAGLFALFPVAYGVGWLCERLPRIGALVALAGAALVVLVLPGWNRTGAELAHQQAPPVPQMREAAAQLAKVVPPGARFATQRRFPEEITDTGVSHPDFWLAQQSGRDTLNAFNAESSSVHDLVFAPEAIGNQAPDVTADTLAPLGVTHVVTVDPLTAARLAASPRFSMVWQSPPLAVFALMPADGQPPPASLLATSGPASASLRDPGPDHIVIDATAREATTATAAVAWSPQWHLRIDGRPAPLGRDKHNLLQFALPAGAHTVALSYRSDLADK
ncbi:MAG: hypothetical protein E6G01_08035, partial [Actinobacteria bacterium]